MKHRAIAICGLIGAGKSAVGSYLSQQGYVVVDCDDISRKLATDEVIIGKVHQLLGDSSIEGDELNRQYIRSVVFADGALHSQYTAIFAEAVRDVVLDIVASNQLVFVQLPVFDAIPCQWYAVWNVVCNDNSRIQRTVIRDNTSVEDIQRISSRQQVVEGSVTIDNSGSIAQLHRCIDRLLATLN